MRSLPIALTGLALMACIRTPDALAAAPPDVLALAPAISEGAPATTARGVFHRQLGQLNVPAATVLISSSPDGLGALCTDDEATLIFRQPTAPPQVWTHLFADRSRGVIACIPPQRLTLNGGPGAYEVELMLTDRFSFTYSSRAYFVIADLAPPPAATPAPEVTLTAGRPSTAPTAAAPALAATQPNPTPTRVLNHQAVPEQAATPAATPRATLAPTPSARLPEGDGPHASPLLARGLLFIAATLAAWLLLRSRRRPLRLSGIVDLRDRATGEARTVLLHRFAHGAAVVRAPLDLAAPGAAPDRRIATLSPSPNGPLLAMTGDEQCPPLLLRDGIELLLAQSVELRYRRSAPAFRPTATHERRPE